MSCEKRSVGALHEHFRNEIGADFGHLQRELEIQSHSKAEFEYLLSSG
jgi:hypothetical protein